MTCPVPPAPFSALRRRFRPRLLGVTALVAASCVVGAAEAQSDTYPLPPNIMLLIDTSGSMDYKTGNNSFPACKYVDQTSTSTVSERSRWVDLVEVLTGSVSQYDCQKLNRNSLNFRTEYRVNGVLTPYDSQYANPYHRPASNGCVPGPGYVDLLNPQSFAANAIKYHAFDNTSSTCTFNQASDGVLDSFLTEVRFGLMTFDTEPAAAKDMSGLWSYYVGSSKAGRPEGCPTDQAQEVGVRNVEAPPWEGRAVGFGNPAAGSVDFKSRNAMIQQILLATRPYGATPIAGMLDDAKSYFLADTSADPLDSSFKFGPKEDPNKSCRRQAVVLLSDGQPNMDLRPHCEPGHCPYDKAEDLAQSLKAAGVPIYVIGFALSSVTVDGTPRQCSSFTSSELDQGSASSLCSTHASDSAIQACCALNRIAAAGGPVPTSRQADWRRARFADNRDALRAALSLAIGANLKTTSRTPPISGNAVGVNGWDRTFSVGSQFHAGYAPATASNPWSGTLTRERWTCQTNSVTSKVEPVRADFDASLGDDFALNVNSTAASSRKLFSVIGSVVSGEIKSDESMRPNLASDPNDGVGNYSGTTTTIQAPAGFVSDVPAAAMKLTDTSCNPTITTAAQCRDKYLKWVVGLDNGTTDSRCNADSGVKCSLFGDIYHSTPRVVGPPAEILNDQSYTRFAQSAALRARPPVLYTSTNDGFLHALQVSAVETTDTVQVKTKANNELWAFAPPGVLTGIPSQYPGSHQLLLDGAPVVKDVVARLDSAATGYKYKLERTQVDAQGSNGLWRTILVQSFGAARPGYFALDVTDPRPSTDSTKGPKFLWQLSTAKDGTPLFGTGGATPLITTLFINSTEVAVAVLPGGYGSAGTSGSGSGCARVTTVSSFPGSLKPRANVPCYTGSGIAARSLTIVRLDTGQILRTFRRDDDEVPLLKSANLVTEAPLDSPLTGEPVVFPADVGAVADRLFIGDQDGAIWRLNLGSGTPADWKMDLFFDGFPSALGHTWNGGQPIATRPVLSVTPRGDLTVAFSSGEQEAVGSSPGVTNYIWSLTEESNLAHTTLTPKVNWYLPLKAPSFGGDRAVGSMSLFGGYLYFSTVGPAASGTVADCASGSSKVFGVHYLQLADATDIAKGGKSFFSTPYLTSADVLGTGVQDGFISGVAITQQPSCANGSGTLDNEYLSYGDTVRTQSLGSITSGKFQLVMHTGDQLSKTVKAGFTPFSSGDINGVAVDLPSPPIATRIDSWAAIVE